MKTKRNLSACEHLPVSRGIYADALKPTSVPPCGAGHLLCLSCGHRSASLAEHHKHPIPQGAGHEVVLDLQCMELYCTSCSDYVYQLHFDTLKLAILSGPSSAAGSGRVPGITLPLMSTSGGIAEPAFQPRPSFQLRAATNGTAAASAPASQLPGSALQPLADDGFPPGLRGLNNMGNTCFMNSVLQGLLHAPLLRNYYLLGGHCKQACSITADGGLCVGCELDEVFNEVYSGTRSAYSPAQFLYTWWMLAGSHLGSYQQHDAHEFLLFVLEMLGSAGGSSSSSTTTCGNISSHVFGGMLRSDVVCTSCGNVSTTQDPFTHLSLDIPPRELLIPAPILPRPSTNHGGGSKAGGGSSKGGRNGTSGHKLYGAAAAAAARRRSREGVQEASGDVSPPSLPGLTAPGGLPGPAPSSSVDRCTSSGDVCDEAAGSINTLSGNGGALGAEQPRQEGGGSFPPAPNGHAMLAFPAAGALRGPAPEQGPAAGAAPDAMSQLEAASAVGGPGGLGDDDSEDAAQDTLSSPRMSQAGSGRRPQARPGTRGRPPIPRSGRGARRAGGRAGQPRRQRMACAPAEPGPATMALLGTQPEASDTAMASQDTLAANTNLPGSQTTEALAANGAAAAGPAVVAPRSPGSLPPQLAGYQRWPAASLLGCLHRFVRQEALEPCERLQCSRCRSQHAVKQLSVRQLPPVLVFHTKRFEHPGGLRAVARKLETDLAFPLTGLDMQPFLTSSVLRARHGLRPGMYEHLGSHASAAAEQGSRSTAGHGSSPASLGVATTAAATGEAGGNVAQQQPILAAVEGFLYDLYAVVCHRGSFQGGHYVAYVRAGDGRWYLCDDAWVVGVEESVVRHVQAYMLFYCRRGLSGFS